MPYVMGKCDDCGADIEIRFGYHPVKYWNGLRWWEACRCRKCGYAYEADGYDIPDHYRQIFYAEEGIWAARIPAEGVDAHFLKAVRGLLGLNMARAATLLKSKSPTFASGTRAEMMWLQAGLAEQGITVALVRQEDGG